MKTFAFGICLMAVIILPQTAVASDYRGDYDDYDDYEFFEHQGSRESRHRNDTIVIVVKPRRPREHQGSYIRECWAEEIRYPGRDAHRGAAGRMITGGIVGGVIGYQFGRGHGRDAFALLGTLIGASLGHDMAYQRHQGERRRVFKKRCRFSQHRHHY